MKTIFLIYLIFNGVEAFGSIVGQISRMPVTRTDQGVFRSIGQIENFCTGTLIAPRLVLTAGHCVYDLEQHEWLPVREFTPGRLGPFEPFGRVKVKQIFVHPKFLKGSMEHDLAVLVLNEPIGIQLGWHQIDGSLDRFYPHGSALGGWRANMTITGYPGDKPDGTMWVVVCNLYMSTQRPYQSQYTCDTYGGMSGSAISVAHPKYNSVIVGVHTRGHGQFNAGVSLYEPSNLIFVKDLIQKFSITGLVRGSKNN